MNREKLAAVLGVPLVGWGLCAATMGIAMATLPLGVALVFHTLAAPILFIFVSVFYFQRFAYTTPLNTAFIFVMVVLFMDFFVVGLVMIRDLSMFANPLGVWIPLLLIFTATHITGLLVTSGKRYSVPAR